MLLFCGILFFQLPPEEARRRGGEALDTADVGKLGAKGQTLILEGGVVPDKDSHDLCTGPAQGADLQGGVPDGVVSGVGGAAAEAEPAAEP